MGLLGRVTPGIYEAFIREKCEVEIILTAGANCCRLRGIICGVIQCGKAITVFDCKTRSECVVAVDKICSICRVRPTTRRRLF
ncbi:hypothetical protein [Natronospora cellulosivora (SeqCode)]